MKDKTDQNMVLTIKKPLAAQAAQLAMIAKASDIRTLDSLQKGFLLFPWKEYQFREHINNNGLIYAFYDFSGIPIGVITGFTSEDISRRLMNNANDAQMVLLNAIHHKANECGDREYAIAYQLALTPEMQSKGLGYQCVKLFIRQIRNNMPIYGVVLEKPVLCIRRIFWHYLGFRRIDEISMPVPESLKLVFNQAKNESEMVFGIFRNPNI